ncbi:MAG: hypothetical protein BGN83_19520 [Rhizobium sp. 63-7]|nr:MAG: hypothetical protein BGN83_19520 [Rhizobium sp. 63-7]
MGKFAQIARPVVLAQVSQDLGEEGRFGALEPAGSTFAVATMRLSTGLVSLVPELKKVGRIAGKALIYFLTFSTPALAIGMIADNVVQRPAWSANRVADRRFPAIAQPRPDVGDWPGIGSARVAHSFHILYEAAGAPVVLRRAI